VKYFMEQVLKFAESKQN
jgi:hypothetical protein